MTDEQFDEVCRNALAFDPGAARESTWSKIRPARRSWLPTVPEILTCGCACGLALLAIGMRFGHSQEFASEPNPVVQRALGRSLVGLQVSAVQLPDTTAWTESSLSLPSIHGSVMRQAP